VHSKDVSVSIAVGVRRNHILSTRHEGNAAAHTKRTGIFETWTHAVKVMPKPDAVCLMTNLAGQFAVSCPTQLN